MNADLACALPFGAISVAAGWFLVHVRSTRASGWLLAAGGGLVLVGVGASLIDLSGTAEGVFRAAGTVLIPLSFLAYPRLRVRDPLSFVLLVSAGSAGAISLIWSNSFEPMAYVIGCALVVHVWWSYERGDAEERRSSMWSALAWGGAGLLFVLTGFVLESAGDSHWSVGVIGLSFACIGPPAMTIGVVRPEVVDVRGLITRAVVAGTVLAVYVAIATTLAALIEELRGDPLAATPVVVLCAVLAFGVRPLQLLLRGVVDQLLFGDRPDPLVAATSLADQIGDDPALALEAIRDALVLPYASLRVGGDELASSGTEVTHTRVLPLRLGADEVGEFVIGLRAGDLGLSGADTDVLRIVAPLLAQTLRAQAMARDLQASREAVVTAVEEERRRLRRDLHDGLGPTLTGVAFATDAASNEVHRDPDRAAALLSALREDTAAAINEIRRLVEGLRPPALDQVGLVGSIRQYADTLLSADGSRLLVTVDIPQPLPEMSAAAEVAAYRILVEALTNAARHAAARSARVSIAVHDSSLLLSVRDDGSSPSEWKPGVGITSMRERSQLVGGTLTVTSSPGGGLVEASIPLGRGGG